jgi:hypothetical protein
MAASYSFVKDKKNGDPDTPHRNHHLGEKVLLCEFLLAPYGAMIQLSRMKSNYETSTANTLGRLSNRSAVRTAIAYAPTPRVVVRTASASWRPGNASLTNEWGKTNEKRTILKSVTKTDLRRYTRKRGCSIHTAGYHGRRIGASHSQRKKEGRRIGTNTVCG